jgi:hypothetical protein
MKRSSTEAQLYWELRYQEQQKSGQTVVEYCKAQGIKTNTYRKALVRYNLRVPIDVCRAGLLDKRCHIDFI